jgi:hypothetical protein
VPFSFICGNGLFLCFILFLVGFIELKMKPNFVFVWFLFISVDSKKIIGLLRIVCHCFVSFLILKYFCFVLFFFFCEKYNLKAFKTNRYNSKGLFIHLRHFQFYFLLLKPKKKKKNRTTNQQNQRKSKKNFSLD